MELNNQDNLFNQEKSPKKKISPFLHKLYNILEVSKIKILQLKQLIYRMKKIIIL